MYVHDYVRIDTKVSVSKKQVILSLLDAFISMLVLGIAVLSIFGILIVL